MGYQPKKWQVRVGEKLYPFVTYTKREAISCQQGVYIFAYTHLRGHLAGYQLNILKVTQAENFHQAVQGGDALAALEQRHWNSVYFLDLPDSEEKNLLVKAVSAIDSPLYSS